MVFVCPESSGMDAEDKHHGDDESPDKDNGEPNPETEAVP